MIGIACLLLFLAAAASAADDAHFVLEVHDAIDARKVDHIRSQLELGLQALRSLPITLHEDRFPITVHLHRQRGVSNSSGGQGPIHLYNVGGRRNPAAVHELTHVLTGYHGFTGDAHWSSEGFASYVQDTYGEQSYPTRGHPHALAKLIFERGMGLPMTKLMQARERSTYFGLKEDAWTRWRAYALSTSFTTYLIEQYGLQKFIALYRRRASTDQLGELKTLYGVSAEDLIAQWRRFLDGPQNDMKEAEIFYGLFENAFR